MKYKAIRNIKTGEIFTDRDFVLEPITVTIGGNEEKLSKLPKPGDVIRCPDGTLFVIELKP